MNNESTEKTSSMVTILVNQEWCKRCGICSAFCPAGVYDTDDFGLPSPVHYDRCTRCMLCVMLCPDFAIEVIEAKDRVGAVAQD